MKIPCGISVDGSGSKWKFHSQAFFQNMTDKHEPPETNQGPDGSFGALVDVSEKSENINMNSLRYIIKCFPMCTWVMLMSTNMYIIVHRPQQWNHMPNILSITTASPNLLWPYCPCHPVFILWVIQLLLVILLVFEFFLLTCVLRLSLYFQA